MRLGFLLFIGVPGSGKTTFAKYLVKNIQYSGGSLRFIHICYDDLMADKSYDSEWKIFRNSVYSRIEKLVLALKDKNVDMCPQEFKNQFNSVDTWEGDFVFILDDNMYFKSMRYSVFQMAKKHRMSFCQVFFNCSLENALLKNDLREPNSVVPRHVIENMHCKIEPPNPKNHWEKYSVEVKAFCELGDIYCKILPILNDSLNNFYYVKDDGDIRELSVIQCKKSVLHQADLALRKIISFNMKKYLKENSKGDSKEYIAGLNLRKSEILSDLKTGDVCLPDEILDEINSDIPEKYQLINFLSGYF